MKVSCDIIKDLLPLYYDGVCSAASRIMVEEHLEECQDCRAELEAMGRVLPVSNKEKNLSDAEAVKKLSKRWKKGMIGSILKGALFTLITVIIVLLILYLFVDIRIA